MICSSKFDFESRLCYRAFTATSREDVKHEESILSEKNLDFYQGG